MFKPEYGYEFMREHPFSFGLSIAPVVPLFYLNEEVFEFSSLLGIFGKYENKRFISYFDYRTSYFSYIKLLSSISFPTDKVSIRALLSIVNSY